MHHPNLVQALERLSVGAVGLTARALSQAVPGIELTLPQWRALLIVGEDADGARIGTVASRVGATVPATSRLLRRLEARGYVALVPDAEDGRATRATMTARGAWVRAAVVEYRRGVLQEIAASVAARADEPLATGLGRIGDALGRFA